MLVKGTSADRKKLGFLALAGLVFLGLLIYSNVVHAPFFFDDFSSIVDNETIKNLPASFVDFSNNRYLTHITFAINYALSGLRPFSYHIANNTIHVINAILVYYLVIFTFRTPQMHNSRLSPQFIALSSAFLFISHPIQTQAVTYIVQRATSMATLFYLLSLVAYSKWRLMRERDLADKGQTTGGRDFNVMVYFISFVSAVLAMKTKEIAFTLPMILVLYEFSFFNKCAGPLPLPDRVAGDSRNSNLQRLIYLVPMLLTMLIIPLSMASYSVKAESLMQDIDTVTREALNVSRTDYLLTQFRVIITYMRLLLLPVNQNFDYRYPVYHSFFDLQVLLSFAAILAIIGLSVYCFYLSRCDVITSPPEKNLRNYQGLRLASFGIQWFFITLLVESSIVPIKDVIVEHRLYLPSVGFIIASVSLSDFMIKNPGLKKILVVVIVCLLSLSAYSRNSLWNEPEKMWGDVISKAPRNVRAYTELGAVFRDEGRYPEAILQFERALEINKDYPLTYYNLGYVQYKLGNYGNALQYFQKTLTLKPHPMTQVDTLNSMGMTYSEMGDDRNAVSTFKEAIRILPGSIISYNNLGHQYVKMGNADLAIKALKKGLKIRAESHLYYNLYLAYELKGDKENSMLMKQKAVSLSDK